MTTVQEPTKPLHPEWAALADRFYQYNRGRETQLGYEVMRNPVSSYTSPGVWELERERLFGAVPLVLGLSCDIPNPGDYLTAEMGDVPVILLRGDDGNVQCFVNACRHRGTRLLDGRGSISSTIRCPYHCWTYDRTGALRSQPFSSGGFDGMGSDIRLAQASVSEIAGLLFVSRSGKPSVAAEIDGMRTELEYLNLTDFVFVEEAVSTWAMNWKMAVDTFTESYHIFSLHPRLVKSFLSLPMLVDTFGPHFRTVTWRSNVPEDRAEIVTAQDFRRFASLVYFLFPNVVINLPTSRHAELWRIVPGKTVDEVTAYVSFYAPAAERGREEHWRKMFQATRDVVYNEDFATQQKSYAGFRAGAVDELVYGRNEPALSHAHTMWRRQIGDETLAR
jgi:phenylpropionate dioxygenase-like ring-hydroxylating dioxygenase large terminal subunit